MRYKLVLEQLGFAPSEIQVYTALLELDSATPTEISKRSGINRTSCYDVLEHLVRRGLVSKFKKRKKIFFTAGDPRRLLQYMDREKEEFTKKIDQQKEQIKEIIPELVSFLNPTSTKPKVTFYEGVKGMREAYEDTLTSENTILAYANVEEVHKGIPNFFPEYYTRRANANIPIKAIFTNNTAAFELTKHDHEVKRESIILEDKSQTFSPEVNIYNDKMLVASWKEKMAVIIESKELADLQRLIHKLLWQALKKK